MGRLSFKRFSTCSLLLRLGSGRAMLEAALERGRALGYKTVRLYTGSTLAHLIAWYGRHGFEIERTEALSDRSITHMVKSLAGVQA